MLLGDSIFDNAACVAAGVPDVFRQVRQRLPYGSEATHLVVSAGGNDALHSSDFLTAPARSTAEALLGLADIAEEFERGYLATLAGVLTRGLPTAICTVYYPRLPEAALQRMAVTAMTVFNDCIIRAAFAHGLPLLDLRSICTEGDYAKPIEPSAQGWRQDRASYSEVGGTRFRRGQDRVVYLSRTTSGEAAKTPVLVR